MSALTETLRLAVLSGHLKKLVLSKAEPGYPARVTGRLCRFRGENTLSTEASLTGGKVMHRNIKLSELTDAALQKLVLPYSQVNLITSVGDAEYKRSQNGKESYIGFPKLEKLLLSSERKDVLSSLDRQKHYLLNGTEPFLHALGISDQDGRVHDKKQAKFRQINRFLEHLETIYPHLPAEGELLVYDLCCGKSYLSFAVYHYLTVLQQRKVTLLGIDRKEDVIAFCNGVAAASGFTGMRFLADDVRNTPKDRRVHLVTSLHACDIATDIVLDTAVSLPADVILSTPCCQKYWEDKISYAPLSFVTDHPFLRHKLNETLTDALRALRLRSLGYKVTAVELTDPDDTPKNTLIRAIRKADFDPLSEAAIRARKEYTETLSLIFGGTHDRIAEVLPK